MLLWQSLRGSNPPDLFRDGEVATPSSPRDYVEEGKGFEPLCRFTDI